MGDLEVFGRAELKQCLEVSIPGGQQVRRDKRSHGPENMVLRRLGSFVRDRV